ncbi:MAG TPA: tripartite tricarboxylate transporter substrate-binding protein [Burkholderiaceae bacterium]|nr:tripartite tricarboxylate transporter substrate-binding protein [Burkholderiaceae bacterium]
MTHPFSRRSLVFAGLGGIAALPGVRAQTPAPVPTRPVRIVPFGAPGGPIDTLARVYAERLQQRWGQPVIVDAKPGASGIVAADFVAKAAPDGHTVMMTLPLTHVNLPILQAKMPYDPVADFTPLSMVATGGAVLVARASAPYGNLKEVIEVGRRQGKPLYYGTWGNGSTAHLFGELLKRQTDVPLTHVAYKAEAQVHQDLFGENLDFAWANPATARGHVQSGKMKVLGIAGTRRVSALPQVPTFAEQGFAGFDVDSWVGLYAPARLPAPWQETWATALREITRQPEVSARLTAFGFEPLANTPAEFTERYKADFPRTAELIRAAGVKAE